MDARFIRQFILIYYNSTTIVVVNGYEIYCPLLKVTLCTNEHSIEWLMRNVE